VFVHQRQLQICTMVDTVSSHDGTVLMRQLQSQTCLVRSITASRITAVACNRGYVQACGVWRPCLSISVAATCTRVDICGSQHSTVLCASGGPDLRSPARSILSDHKAVACQRVRKPVGLETRACPSASLQPAHERDICSSYDGTVLMRRLRSSDSEVSWAVPLLLPQDCSSGA
jgi:hypothetical protein